MKNVHHIKYLYVPARGVITHGNPKVSDILPSPRTQYSPDHLLHITASAMAQSNHPLADAICNYADEKSVPYDVFSATMHHAGFGVEADISGINLLIGTRRYMQEKLVRIDALIEQADRLSLSGKTVLYIAAENVLAGIIALDDALNQEMAAFAKKLHRQGISVILAGNDHHQSLSALANFAGIERVASEMTAEEVAEHMRRHRSENRLVATVLGTDSAEYFADSDFHFNSLAEFVDLLEASRKNYFKQTQFTFEEIMYRFVTFTVIALVLFVIFDTFTRTVPALSAGILTSLAIQLGSYLVHNH